MGYRIGRHSFHQGVVQTLLDKGKNELQYNEVQNLIGSKVWEWKFWDWIFCCWYFRGESILKSTDYVKFEEEKEFGIASMRG